MHFSRDTLDTQYTHHTFKTQFTHDTQMWKYLLWIRIKYEWNTHKKHTGNSIRIIRILRIIRFLRRIRRIRRRGNFVRIIRMKYAYNTHTIRMKYTGEKNTHNTHTWKNLRKNRPEIRMKYAWYAMCVFRHFQYAKYAQYASIRTDQFADVMLISWFVWVWYHRYKSVISYACDIIVLWS